MRKDNERTDEAKPTNCKYNSAATIEVGGIQQTNDVGGQQKYKKPYCYAHPQDLCSAFRKMPRIVTYNLMEAKRARYY